MKTNTQKAFTLIELLIVVSVISLLSTVILYQTSEARLKADDAKMKQQVKEVEKAVLLYREDNGFVPYSSSYENIMLSEDDDDVDKKAAYEESLGMLVPDYIPAIPTSPDGTSYSYMATTDGGSAVFAANLNNSSSNSGNNSCDVVGGDASVNYSNCRALPDPEECWWGTYDSETEVCYTGPQIFRNCICEPETSNRYSYDNSVMPDSLCVTLFSPSCGFPFSPDDYICDYTTSTPVCSGGSNSDYCSCI